MAGPLDKISVLEIANYLAVPSAGGLMADMGADVIKVEPPIGDPWRDVTRNDDYNYCFPMNYPFEMDNRGKRGIAVDITKKQGNDIIRRLAEKVDVLITNMLPRRLERYKLRYEDLEPSNPRLIYLSFNGYGPEGPDKDRPGYDHTAFWARSGLMHLFTPPGHEPIDLQLGMGDHTTAPMLLVGVLAALLDREHTGRGQKVTGSLLNMAMWVMGGDVEEMLHARRERKRYFHSEPQDPLYNTYRSRDGRWFTLILNPGYDNFLKLCKAFRREDIAQNPRYQTERGRIDHSREIVAELDTGVNQMTLAEVGARMDELGIVWAPMQTLLESIDDSQAKANHFFRTIEHPKHGPYQVVDTPVRFSRSDAYARSAAPLLGQHTVEVLMGLGYSEQEIESLKASGAIATG